MQCINRALAFGFLTFSTFAAQASFNDASVETCNIKGQVTITVFGGVTSSYPIGCFNETERNSSGTDEQSTTGEVEINLTPMMNVASVEAPLSVATHFVDNSISAFWGFAETEKVTFVQDNIELSGLQGGMLILDDGTSETVYYAAATNLVTLTVGGVVYPIPSPIPVNHHIVIGELNVDVSVAGYGLLKVPVSGGLTLNRLAITDGADVKRIEHSPAHLELKGEAHVLGQSIAEINITIDDYSDFNESQTQVGSFVFTSLETLRNGNIPLASELRGMDELSQ